MKLSVDINGPHRIFLNIFCLLFTFHCCATIRPKPNAVIVMKCTAHIHVPNEQGMKGMNPFFLMIP